MKQITKILIGAAAVAAVGATVYLFMPKKAKAVTPPADGDYEDADGQEEMTADGDDEGADGQEEMTADGDCDCPKRKARNSSNPNWTGRKNMIHKARPNNGESRMKRIARKVAESNRKK
jgi:hypothetical protein